MRATALFVGIFLASLCVTAGGQSQQPSPGVPQSQANDQAKTQSNQQNPADSEKEPNEIPIATIRILGPKPSAANSTDHHTEESRNYSTDWWMFGATVGIGFIGLLQLIAFIKQASYMAESAKEMKKTTDATIKTSLDQIEHSHKIERAYISGGGAPAVIMADLGTETTPGVMGGGVTRHLGMEAIPTGYFRLDINNHGKTGGDILEYGYGFWEAAKIKELPPIPSYRWVYYKDQIGPGTQSRPIKRVKVPKGKTIIFGRYGYRDIFGKYHSSGFIQDGGTPIAPPHSAYTEADPDWDLPNVGTRKYEDEEPQF